MGRLPKILFLLLSASVLLSGCRTRSDAFVLGLETEPETLDPLRGADAQSERFRQMMFDTLVRKNAQLEYVPELAERIETSDDRQTVTFTLHDNVRFHDGRPLTSADVKYTFDTLLGSQNNDYKKAPSFFEGTLDARQPFITSVEARDPRTAIFHLRKPWSELAANLTTIAIIPQGSAGEQATHPLGSGAFKFVKYDQAQKIVDLEANENYWQGAPQIKKLRVRVILDANTLQAELRSGRIDLVASASNLTSDSYKALEQDSNLVVKQFPGANVVYLGFNTESDVVGNPRPDDANATARAIRVRQAIAYAINREQIIGDLLLGQARIAHSILPEESWAYSIGEKYTYDPARAKKLLDEAGYPDPDGDGTRMRFDKPIVFKMSTSNATRQYAGVIQNSLKEIGVPSDIQTLELVTLGVDQRNGQYQMTTARWVGGNQDPIFLRDLFTAGGKFNRSRYRNPRVDALLNEAVVTVDREQARRLYAEAQEIISREAPMIPLWYPATMVVTRRSVGNIGIDPSGDWNFVRNLTVEGR